MSNKKKFFVIILVIFSVSIAGGIFTSRYGALRQANFFEYLQNLLEGKPLERKPLVPAPPMPAESGAEEKNDSGAAELYRPVQDYENAVISAVESATQSVVSIVITKDLPVIERCPYNPFGYLPPEFRDFFGNDFGIPFYQPCKRGTERREVGGGSGFIVSPDGLIVTNKHVVVDTEADYTVLTNDGKKYEARVVARDPVLDLAIIQVNGSGFSAARLGDSDTVKLGQTAIAIGNALGEFRNTVSVGVISGLARNITASGGGGFVERVEGVIQTDAAINPGNSGGPLLNLSGEVIGINTAIAEGAQNIGFAIPINQAKRAINSVRKTGTIQTPFLGVRYLLITPDIAKKQGLPSDYGVLLRGTSDGPAIFPNSPAQKAGLQAEDIILEVDGERIDADHSLASIIQKHEVGDTVRLKILRNGEEFSVTVTLDKRPNL